MQPWRWGFFVASALLYLLFFVSFIAK